MPNSDSSFHLLAYASESHLEPQGMSTFSSLQQFDEKLCSLSEVIEYLQSMGGPSDSDPGAGRSRQVSQMPA